MYVENILNFLNIIKLELAFDFNIKCSNNKKKISQNQLQFRKSSLKNI